MENILLFVTDHSVLHRFPNSTRFVHPILCLCLNKTGWSQGSVSYGKVRVPPLLEVGLPGQQAGKEERTGGDEPS